MFWIEPIAHDLLYTQIIKHYYIDGLGGDQCEGWFGAHRYFLAVNIFSLLTATHEDSPPTHAFIPLFVHNFPSLLLATCLRFHCLVPLPLLCALVLVWSVRPNDMGSS